MKSLLELEKEIPATVLAAGVHEFMRNYGVGTLDSRLRAAFAAMQYEQQLLIAGQQTQIRELSLARRSQRR